MRRIASAPTSRGFSLIELLVSLGIALVLTLAISNVLIRAESAKRSTTSVNDTNQGGAFAAYTLDRVIRSAGSGYTQRWRELFGCPLVGSKGGAALNFRSTVWTDSGYSSQKFVLAPVLIGINQANTSTATRGDLLTVMAGTAGYAEAPQAVTATSSSSIIPVANPLGYQTSDLVLIGDPAVTAGCMVEQLGAVGTTGALPVTGSYATASGTGAGPVSLSSFGTGAFLAQLGSADTTRNNPPEFITYGVTDNNILSAYDILQVSGSTPTEVSDGVVEMHALYGLDTANVTGNSVPSNSVHQWVAPTVTSGYDIATLLGGNQLPKLRNIIAIRVGLILRTSQIEKDPVAQPQTLTLFADQPAATYTRTLSGTDLYYRFRTIEMTIPLRNVAMLKDQ